MGINNNTWANGTPNNQITGNRVIDYDGSQPSYLFG